MEAFARPSQLIQEAIGERPDFGAQRAEPCRGAGAGLPASVVVSGTHEPLNEQIRDALSHDAFRVYTSSDALGVELAGALKNILGIAAGICDGLGSGDNAKAALLTRGLVEIARLGVDLGRGTRRSTAWRAWATSSRPVTVRMAAIARSASGSAEGKRSIRCSAGWSTLPKECRRPVASMRSHCRRGVEMPITSELYQILFEGKPPRSAVADLMVRAPKVEWSW